jgi:hypothetical protein
VPQSARNVFTLLAQADRIPDSLAIALRNRAGFRNIAVPDYQVLQLVVTVAAIEQHLDDFLLFSKMLLMHDKTSSSSYRQLLLIFVTYRLPHSISIFRKFDALNIRFNLPCIERYSATAAFCRIPINVHVKHNPPCGRYHAQWVIFNSLHEFQSFSYSGLSSAYLRIARFFAQACGLSRSGCGIGSGSLYPDHALSARRNLAERPRDALSHRR